MGLHFFIYSGLVNSVTSLIFGGFILLRNPRSAINRGFAYFAFSVSFWAFFYFLWLSAKNSFDALFFIRTAMAAAVLIPASFIYFITRLLSSDKKYLNGFNFLSGLVFILFSFSTVYIKDVEPRGGFPFWPVPGFLFHIMLLQFFLNTSYAHILLGQAIRKSAGLKRNQLKYIFLGTLAGFVGGSTNFFLWYKIQIPPYLNFLVSFYVISVAYSIFRYRLLDIRLAITKVGIFVLVYTFVLGIPFAMGFWGRPALAWIAGGNWWLLPMAAMAAMALTGPFVYIHLDKKAEERLLREQRRYQNTLKQASTGMTMIRDIKKLLELMVHIMSRSVRVKYVAIYLWDKENNIYNLSASHGEGYKPAVSLNWDNLLIRELIAGRRPLLLEEIKQHIQDGFGADLENIKIELSALGAAVVVPSLFRERLVGFMVLGDKRSGEIYSKDDLEVFTVVANQAALAIENARFFAESRQMQEQIAQAEKMATIGTMADGLSHQINNRFHALSLISGDALDSLNLNDTSNCLPEQNALWGELKYALERIQDNVMQGAEVVKGMLKYTRKSDSGFGLVSLDQLLDSTLDMVKYKIRLSDIDIIRDYPQDIPGFYGSLTQLQEVFFNLIDNAYDAAMERKQVLKEPGYRGRVRIYTEYPPDGTFKIKVEDNGIGVREEDYKKLFTPFFTTKVSSHKGTGLGLYVIKKIITDNHKGKISLESDYRRGTTFCLELPIEKEFLNPIGG